jgi:hypothetical protein
MDSPATGVRVCGRKRKRGWGKHACQQQYQQEPGRQTMHVLRKKSTKQQDMARIQDYSSSIFQACR